jgi:hypothetical protein
LRVTDGRAALLPPLATATRDDGQHGSIDTAAAVFNDGQGNVDIAVPTVFVASYHLMPHPHA